VAFQGGELLLNDRRYLGIFQGCVHFEAMAVMSVNMSVNMCVNVSMDRSMRFAISKDDVYTRKETVEIGHP